MRLLLVARRFIDKSVWRVIWTLLRRLGFARPRERAATVPVRVRDGRVEVLLIESSKKPGSFVFPGGGVDAGETTEIAAARELLEEAGVSGASCTRLGEFVDDASLTRTAVFLVRVDAVHDTWLESSLLGRRREWFALDALEHALSTKGIHRRALALLQAQHLTPTSF
ncbi:hypothetical protein KFE25_008736 [Diacronema lutheri]|uniref:Nudix hydrolase domain-containing protein n=1 Tax=Diacronema lutheri TaxID=2081491 RepID=A0A8J6CHK4_DIALT|nr:hypothetical protein KFE25_008736 [Diacronema lutheri]